MADDARHPLVQYLGHHQVQQALLLLQEDRAIVRVARQVTQRVGRAPQHVEARAHAFGVVAQRVDPVLLCHHHCVVLDLLDEADQQTDTGVLLADGAGHPAVRSREVVEQVDGELAHDLVLGPVELARQEGA